MSADRPQIDGSKSGLAVLVVEDESLVALNLESVLQDLGHEIVGPVMRIDQLEKMIESGIQADVAILDVNIGGTKVFEQARRLANAGMPIVFATGYGENGLEEDWRHYPVIQKPYSADDVRKALTPFVA